MNTPSPLEPTTQAAWARLRAVRPDDYARSRNHLEGAVTGLSPYLSHGLLTVPQVIAFLRREHGLDMRHRLIAELGWREFFRHVWRHDGPAILRSTHAGPLPDEHYMAELPDDVREARTGLAVIDQAVRTLYRDGLLHNHARLWLASYLVHGRKLHWRVGADWMLSHLLDGDLASNHLSWQWVAGTGSHQPYLFDAANVRRFAPPDWHVDGSVLDVSYETLGSIARDPEARLLPPGLVGRASTPPAVPPALHRLPPDEAFDAPEAQALRGREVWLVHPWCLADPPPGLLPVAVLDEEHHRRWPWTAARWRFVTSRMRQISALHWVAPGAVLAAALGHARGVHGVRDPHLGPAWSRLHLSAPPQAFVEPGRRCRSFSSWWMRTALADDVVQVGSSP